MADLEPSGKSRADADRRSRWARGLLFLVVQVIIIGAFIWFRSGLVLSPADETEALSSSALSSSQAQSSVHDPGGARPTESPSGSRPSAASIDEGEADIEYESTDRRSTSSLADTEEASRSRQARVESVGPAPAEPASRARKAPVSAIDELRQRGLLVPVVGLELDDLKDTFGDPRSGGRQHQGIDIHAPRNRPVIAVEDGRVARLANGQRSGLAVHMTGPERRYLYFYAHLEAFAEGLEEGESVKAGDLIGYVGTSGNAPVNAPHLHFEIRELKSPKRLWRGKAINPYEVYAVSD